MTDIPILFNGTMVRAILAGTKTQTRRIVKPQPKGVDDARYIPRVYWSSRDTHMSAPCPGPAYMQFERPGEYDGRHVGECGFSCPYGQPGDRLWVRETWRSPQKGLVAYHADGTCGAWMDDGDGGQIFNRHGKVIVNHGDDGNFGASKYGDRWRPSIHMPRWASRLTLEVTGVRVERLTSISEADAKAEGCAPAWLDVNQERVNHGTAPTYRQGFARLWESINGPGSWDANPWVWVVEFRRAEVTP